MKPNRAPAVIKLLTNVTIPVPNFFSTIPLIKLEIIVPAAIVINSTPAVSRGALNSTCIKDHDTPNKESGKPKLIKAK